MYLASKYVGLVFWLNESNVAKAIEVLNEFFPGVDCPAPYLQLAIDQRGFLCRNVSVKFSRLSHLQSRKDSLYFPVKFPQFSACVGA